MMEPFRKKKEMILNNWLTTRTHTNALFGKSRNTYGKRESSTPTNNTEEWDITPLLLYPSPPLPLNLY
jgi:hypothetical protein